jgi:hypothetical protein
MTESYPDSPAFRHFQDCIEREAATLARNLVASELYAASTYRDPRDGELRRAVRTRHMADYGAALTYHREFYQRQRAIELGIRPTTSG